MELIFVLITLIVFLIRFALSSGMSPLWMITWYDVDCVVAIRGYAHVVTFTFLSVQRWAEAAKKIAANNRVQVIRRIIE